MEKNHLLEETKETWQVLGFGLNPGPEKDVGGKIKEIWIRSVD